MTDREVSDEISETHKAERDAGSYTKVLVARSFRRDVERTRTQAINVHKALTLPWYDKGPRALNVQAHSAYTAAMRLNRHGYEAAVLQFMSIYPEQPMQEAEKRLGSMFNADDYPEADDIRERFSFKVEISPLPESGDFRASLSASSLKAIKAEYEKQQDERIKAALNNVFQRVCDVTEKMAERLRVYKPAAGSETSKDRFHDSLIYNVRDVADLLPTLNITGDKRLDALQKQLANLASEEPAILRNDEHLRNKTADEAEKLFQKVSSMFS